MIDGTVSITYLSIILFFSGEIIEVRPLEMIDNTKTRLSQYIESDASVIVVGLENITEFEGYLVKLFFY